MKKIAWLLVVALLLQSVPMNAMASQLPESGTVVSGQLIADDTVITEEHIPDETLMKCIRETLKKSDSDVITYAELQEITGCYYSYSKFKDKGWKLIESLEGMQLLTKVKWMDFDGNNITDLTPVKDLQNVATFSCRDNKLTSLPNLTGWTGVQAAFMGLSGNQIAEADIRSKLPSSYTESQLQSIVNSQLSFELVGEDTFYEYYDVNGKEYYPIRLHAWVKGNRTFAMTSATINGKDVTSKIKFNTTPQTGSGKYYHLITGDVAELVAINSENNQMKVVLTDEFGEEYTYTKSFAVKGPQQSYEVFVEDFIYISSQDVVDEGVDIFAVGFPKKSKDIKVDKVELVNEAGTVIATRKSMTETSQKAYKGNEFRYATTGTDVAHAKVAAEYAGANMSNWYQALSYVYSKSGSFYFGKPIEDGFYSLVYRLSDGSTYTYKNVYKAVSHPIVFGVNDTDSTQREHKLHGAFLVDQTGDYISVYVYGVNLSKATAKPVFMDGNSAAISGEVKATEKDDNGCFYRMEKLDSAIWKNWTTDINGIQYQNHDVVIEFPEGVNGEDLRTEGRQTKIEKEPIYFRAWNSLTNTYTLWLSDDTDIDVNCVPTLRAGTGKQEYNGNVWQWKVNVEKYSKTGKVLVETNPHTGVKEVKVVFDMTEEEKKLLPKGTGTPSGCTWEFSYGTTSGEVVTFYQQYSTNDCRDITMVESKDTDVFFLPYWVGAVHSITAGDKDYQFAEEDLVVFGTQLYSKQLQDQPASLDDAHSAPRSSSYLYVAKLGEPPVVCDHKWEKQTKVMASIDRDGIITEVCKNCGETNPDAKVTTIAKIEEVTLSYSSTTYNGKAKKPTVTVKNSKGDKVSSSNYSVSYESGRKYPGEYSVTVALKGNYEGEIPLTFTIQSKAPTSLKASLAEAGGVKLSWKAATGADAYYVYYKASSDKEYTPVEEEVTGTSCTVPNLEPGVKYTFRVVPAFEGKEGLIKSDQSASVSTTTLAKVSGVTVTKYSSSKVKVSWTNVANETGYKIIRIDEDGNTKTYGYKTTSGKSKTITVDPNVTYQYVVKAYKTVGKTDVYGPESDSVPFTLRNVKAVKNVKASLFEDNTQMKVTWSEVPTATGYNVSVKKGTGKYSEPEYVTGTEFVASDLTAGTKYTFKVQPCYVEDGKEVATGTSDTAVAYTLKKVTGVKLAKSSSKVKVSWTNISGESGYEIAQSTYETFEDVVEPIDYKTTSGKNKTLSADKGVTYYYKVRAYKLVGEEKIYGEWSDVKSYKRK